MAIFDRYNLGYDGADLAATRLTDNAREDLSDMIYNIAPYTTPCLSGVGTGRARNTYTEWQTDDLMSVNASNALVDGADAKAGHDAEASERVGNHCQISDKVLRISGRAEAVTKAGRRSEMAYQLMKVSRSLKRDMEATITGNQSSVAGTSSVAAQLGSMIAWISSNTDVSAVGTPSTINGYASGIVSAHTFTGTDRALTETMIRDGCEAAYTAGGEPGVLMMAPAVKTRLSSFLFTASARVATLYKDTQGEGTKGATAQGSVDVFVSDFGALKLVPNRFWGHNGTVPDETYIAGLQLSMWAVLYLRSFRTNKLARTGDAENRQLLVDYTVRANNEKANFLIADLSTGAVTA